MNSIGKLKSIAHQWRHHSSLANVDFRFSCALPFNFVLHTTTTTLLASDSAPLNVTNYIRPRAASLSQSVFELLLPREIKHSLGRRARG